MRLTATVFLALVSLSALAAERTPNDSYYDAIRQDDAQGVTQLLKSEHGVNTKDTRGATPLMYAAAVGSTPMLKLLLDAGADPNTRTSFEATPLMWCSNSIERVRLLVEHGADVNARSKMGHTPLFLAASHAGNGETVRYLLDKGALLEKAADKTGSTPLLAASTTGDTALMELLLARGDKPDTPNQLGFTPLMNAAAFGNAQMVEALLKRGAKVNAQSGANGAKVKHGTILLGSFSALMLAVSGPNTQTTKLLLDAGADVNAQDLRGMTPLMFAVATDHPNPQVIRMLLARKPDQSIRSKSGETVTDWVRKFNDPGVLAAFALPAPAKAQMTKVAKTDSIETRAAAEKAVALMQTSYLSSFREGGCVSCHAGNITSFAVAKARSRGLHIEETQASELARNTRLGFAGGVDAFLERTDPPAPEIFTYSLLALAMENVPADRTTDALVHNLAAQQLTDHSWRQPGVVRPPTLDGHCSSTAFNIFVLQHYAPPARAAEIKTRIQGAAQLLAATTPVTTEDHVMRLLGLTWAGWDTRQLANMRDGVLALQRPDGGWAQTKHLDSDAYATGTALFALKEAGLAQTTTAYRKAVQYLLNTQAADGSWKVSSRSPKFQPYFESGFPYGHDQWISQWATGWASIALANAVPDSKASR